MGYMFIIVVIRFFIYINWMGRRDGVRFKKKVVLSGFRFRLV